MRSTIQLLLTILLNACWQIAVIALFAAACNWLLRGTAAWCRHTVCVAALVISLGLPTISGLNTFEPAPVASREVVRSVPDKVVNRPINLQEIKVSEPATTTLEMPLVEPPPQRDSTAHTATAGAPPASSDGFTPVPVESLDSDSVQYNESGRGARGPSKNGRSPIVVNRTMAALLVALYSLFLLYRGFKLFRAWRRTVAIMRGIESTRVPARAAAIMAKCQMAIGVSRVRVVCSASVPVPITAGVLNPLIILPVKLLREADDEILLSAIGHELVHVARHDYILNLVYELIYLPVSFHPAAALLRRRIKQTRELCCDELVARKLLAAEVYARSLVRLIGSVPLAGRLASDTTIGITDADILEVRIMSLLKTSKPNTRRNTLLLFAVCLLFSAPCAAAAAYTLQFGIDDPESGIVQKQNQDNEASRRLERAREELQRKERELAERVRKNVNPQGEELGTLRRMEVELREASARINREQETQRLRETEQGLRQLHERLAQIITTYPADEARMRELKEKLARLQRSLPENEERSRELRERLAMVEKQYSNAGQMAEHLQSLRRAQEDLARAQQDMTQEKLEKIEKEKYKEHKLAREKYQEALERAAIEDREGQSKIKSKEYEKLIRKELLDEEIRMKLDKEIRMKIEAAEGDRAQELTQQATMAMDRAIQIAVSQHPGKVLSCSLGRHKDGEVFYRLVIIGEGEKRTATHVWVSATDGRILKTEHE